MPIFVLTHHSREVATKGKTTFHFVTEGADSAMEQARAAAGDRNILLQGAHITQQYLQAGQLDEIQLHLVPVLLGDGVRLFDRLGSTSIELERISMVEGDGVTHLRFRVIK